MALKSLWNRFIGRDAEPEVAPPVEPVAPRPAPEQPLPPAEPVPTPFPGPAELPGFVEPSPGAVQPEAQGLAELEMPPPAQPLREALQPGAGVPAPYPLEPAAFLQEPSTEEPTPSERPLAPEPPATPATPPDCPAPSEPATPLAPESPAEPASPAEVPAPTTPSPGPVQPTGFAPSRPVPPEPVFGPSEVPAPIPSPAPPRPPERLAPSEPATPLAPESPAEPATPAEVPAPTTPIPGPAQPNGLRDDGELVEEFDEGAPPAQPLREALQPGAGVPDPIHPLPPLLAEPEAPPPVEPPAPAIPPERPLPSEPVPPPAPPEVPPSIQPIRGPVTPGAFFGQPGAGAPSPYLPETPPEAPVPPAEPGTRPAEPTPLPPGRPDELPPTPAPEVPAPPPVPPEPRPAPTPAAPPKPYDPPAPAPSEPSTPLPGNIPEPLPMPPPGEPSRPLPGQSPESPFVPSALAPLTSVALAEPAPRGGFFARLKAGLSRSTQKLTENLTGLFTKRKLDDEALEELEETLIMADLGVPAARRIVASFRKTRFGREVSGDEVKAALAEEIGSILAPVALPLLVDTAQKPFTVLVVGVNGVGKTTTIAKLGQQWREDGHSVMFAAGDTFRAAAVEQLQVWGDRVGATVVAAAKQGADSAGLAYDALQRAQRERTDILLIDTAGRLHNKSALMEELRKVIRIIRKLDATAPHAVLLVLDATTGQNAIQQTKVFKEMVDVSGLVVTKLDGSAKGGVVVALAQEFGLPVHAVGVGEKAADLRPFDARDYARGLVGLD